MKILQILTHLNIGGISSYAYMLTKYLLRKNIEVGIASSGGYWEDTFKKLGAKIFTINIKTKSELSPKLAKALFQLYKIRKCFNFDIIHSHTRVTQVLSQLFSQLTGISHIAHFHGFYHKNKQRLIRKIIKAQGRVAIAITPYVREELIEIFKAKASRVKTIISGIDLERLKLDASPLPLEGSPKIGSAGRISEIKGFEYLLRSIPLILKKYPQAHLYLMGEGKEEHNLLSLSERLNIRDKFQIIKNVELSRFLKSIDVFCYPSLEEPFGLSVLEAQYFKIPCVVSSVGGLNLIVENFKTGISVPPGNYEKIAESIILLIEDSNLKNKIIQNAFSQVIEKFDFSKKIEEFIEIYNAYTHI